MVTKTALPLQHSSINACALNLLSKCETQTAERIETKYLRNVRFPPAQLGALSAK